MAKTSCKEIVMPLFNSTVEKVAKRVVRGQERTLLSRLDPRREGSFLCSSRAAPLSDRSGVSVTCLVLTAKNYVITGKSPEHTAELLASIGAELTRRGLNITEGRDSQGTHAGWIVTRP